MSMEAYAHASLNDPRLTAPASSATPPQDDRIQRIMQSAVSSEAALKRSSSLGEESKSKKIYRDKKEIKIRENTGAKEPFFPFKSWKLTLEGPGKKTLDLESSQSLQGCSQPKSRLSPTDGALAQLIPSSLLKTQGCKSLEDNACLPRRKDLLWSQTIRLTPQEQEMIEVQKKIAEARKINLSKLFLDNPVRKTTFIQLSIHAWSLQGRRSYNEDAHMVKQTAIGTLLAVCDGHGLTNPLRIQQGEPQPGQAAASYVANSVRDELSQFISDNTFMTKIAFEKWCNHVHEKMPEMEGGTTATIAFHETITDLLYVATVGDTEAWVFRKKDNEIFPIPLSPCMDWTHPDAIKRVKAILPAQEFSQWESSKSKRFPPRTGINVAYSIGDKKLCVDGKTAISHMPLCSMLQLNEGDIALIGCDGIFHFVEDIYKLVADVIKPQWDHPKLAQLIVEYALIKKESKDNITAIVARAVPKVFKTHPKKELPI